ncbi:hypothetical protein [Thermocaproicibacter melissae]|uniref:hypothetical protein n=1 Tax=Thermocaproicibacter melissae TaxID=2966552 RepID=UPI0024B13904|nr:hypothetical protein [Thermocaproicibacter melissae]WBY64946.1 hypothetical protein NOG13_04455 [Thermocaproicibacter melissae]
MALLAAELGLEEADEPPSGNELTVLAATVTEALGTSSSVSDALVVITFPVPMNAPTNKEISKVRMMSGHFRSILFNSINPYRCNSIS